MKIKICTLVFTAALAVSYVNAAETDALKALDEINQLVAKVNSFSAQLEFQEKQKNEDAAASSSIVISKELGWKMEDSTPGREHIVYNDFKVSYDYFPKAKRVIKTTADTPMAREAFRKPADAFNILPALDTATLKFKGTEKLEGETVYMFEGTTTTKFIPAGEPVVRNIKAWVSTVDGLPRKIVEDAGESVGTTVYHDVKTNIALKPSDFQFSPPRDVEVIDVNKLGAKDEPNSRYDMDTTASGDMK
ncbi:MAG: hypothetical protein WCK47_00110 [bacterium]|nr:hypothetical protein [Candidatus Sumerlaeota bacterium]